MSFKNKPEKQKMATINEVYSRIIWDSRLNRNLFVAGFHERVSDAIKEKPLAHWDGSGDIPWHRIRYIRCGDMVVWDRDKHLDLISTGELPAVAWKQDILQPSQDDLAALFANNRVNFKSRSVYNYVTTNRNKNQDIIESENENNSAENEWKLFTGTTQTQNLNSLTIASYNILCNLYNAEKIHTEKRLPAILDELQKCDTDIIALQEVTPEFVEKLLASSWSKNYFISESITGINVKPYGNLLMSKLPFSLVEHQFSGHKRVLVGTWRLNNQLFHVAVVHLTSTRAENSLQKRSRQLATIIDYLQQQSGDCLIVGDFNIRGDEQQEMFNYGNFVDVWQKLRPHEDGYTFDTTRNSLAMMMSLEGKSARFDRIFLRQGEECHYKPTSMNLFGCEPLAGTGGKIYPSDHFGICGVLEFILFPVVSELFIHAKAAIAKRGTECHRRKEEVNLNHFGANGFDFTSAGNSQKFLSGKTDLTKITPVYQSAIVIIPPDDVLASIQEIRQRYDSKFERWMPHITLICGFLPESYFEEAVEIIAPLLAKIQPFRVTLADFQTFSHQKTSTAWLRPVAEIENALHDLQNNLQQLFPQCYEQSTKTTAGFTPHLTVGQFSNPGEATAKLSQWHPLNFTVDSVALVSRREHEPVMVRYIVGLGKNYVEKSVEKIVEDGKTFSELVGLINQLEPQLTETDKLQRQTVLEIIQQACTECLGFEASLHLLGSARLGVETFQSDLDVVCLISNYISGEAFLASVGQRLEGLCEIIQLVINAKVPVLRLKLEGISVDLLVAQFEAELGTEIEGNIQNIQSRIQHQKSIIGCWEADLIVDLISQHLSLDDFRLFLRAIRAWAKKRCIYGNSWGFLGGFSFTLLAAWSCVNRKELSWSSHNNVEGLINTFFQLLNQHDWNQIITLTDVGKNYEVQHPRDWLPIVTSIEPCQNTARNITRSTAKILKDEFARGAAITEKILIGQANWEVLFEPINLQQESEIFLNITVTSSNQETLAKSCNLLEGYITGLVIQLEQLDIFVRPWTRINKKENTAHLVLGLNLPITCEHKTIEMLTQDFISQHILTNADSENNFYVVVCDVSPHSVSVARSAIDAKEDIF
jgi:poly(A) polymerase